MKKAKNIYKRIPDFENQRERLRLAETHYNSFINHTNNYLLYIGGPFKNSLVVKGYINEREEMFLIGVFLNDSKQAFKEGPFPPTTPIIAEYLAIQYCLEHFYRRPENMKIYSDSIKCIMYISSRDYCKICELHTNPKIFEMIKKANLWFQQNNDLFQLMQWNKWEWGANPASIVD